MSASRLRLVFIAIVAVLFVSMIVAWGSAFVPFAISIVIAYILDPFVVFLMRRLRMPRTLAVVLVFLLFLVIFGLLVAFLYPMLANGVSSITRTVTDNEAKISQFLKDAENWLEQMDLPLAIDSGKLVSSLFAEAETFLKHFFGELSSFAISIIGSIPLLILIPLIIFYLLKDKEKIFDVLKKYTRDDNEARIRIVFDEVNTRLGGYVKGQVFLSGIVAVITTLAMLLFDVPYAVLIGLANGVLNVIPYFGPVIGAVPAVILELASFTTTGHFLGVVIFFVAMNILVSTILSPKIFAHATNLHPVVVLLALFVGATAMGMMGMIVAIPVAIVLQTLIRIIFDTYIKEI